MDNQSNSWVDGPVAPAQMELPKLRTFIIRRREVTNVRGTTVEEITVHAHLVTAFNDSGTILFTSYTLNNNELTGTYTRIFNDWLDVEEVTPVATSIIH